MQFPKINKSNKTGRKGINILAEIIEAELEWLFRPNHLEDDFGIDGYIDIITDEGYLTGKSIGIQVKSGKSYFIKQGNYGWKFNGELKHLNYYLNSVSPIFIILVDIENRLAYWEICKPDKIIRNKNKWFLTIPKSQVIKKSKKEHILNYVSPIVDYASQFNNFWELNKKLVDFDRIVLFIDKKDILNNNYLPLIDMISHLTSNIHLLHETREALDISIHGYNSDKRELIQIPKVKNWIDNVIDNVPGITYFLYKGKFTQFLKVLTLCYISDFDIDDEIITKSDGRKGRMISFDSEKLSKFIEVLFYDLNFFTDAFNIDIEINKEVTNNIFNFFKSETIGYYDNKSSNS